MIDLAAELRALADRVDELDPARIVGELEALRFSIWTANVTAPEMKIATEDRLLTPKEVSQRTRLSVRWLYRHADTLPFTRRVARKVLFSSSGLEKWLATRRP